jgi:hypothetical protein
MGDTAVVREVMEQNIQYPMFGRDYHKRQQYSARIRVVRELIKKPLRTIISLTFKFNKEVDGSNPTNQNQHENHVFDKYVHTIFLVDL